MSNLIDWSSTAITGIRLLANATSNITNTSSAISNFTLNNSTDSIIADAISGNDTSSSNYSTTDFNNNTNGDDYGTNTAPNNVDLFGGNSANCEDSGNGCNGWYIAIAAVMIVMLCICCNKFDVNDDVTDGLNNNDNTSPIQPPTMQAQQVVENHSYAAQVRKMTPEERIALYNKAFDVNKNQVILTSNHIIMEDHHHPSQHHDSDDDNDVESVNSFDSTGDHSVHLSLDYARAQRRSSLIKQGSSRAFNITNGSKRVLTRRRSSIAHPRDHNDDNVGVVVAGGGITTTDYYSKKDVVNKSTRTLSVTMIGKPIPSPAVVRGECVICFDDMEVGDLIVWSESTSCRHVYHKECMVAFLAHKRRMKKQTKMEAPCPTCRQHYVTVIEPSPSPTLDDDEEEEDDTNGNTDNTNDDNNAVNEGTTNTENNDNNEGGNMNGTIDYDISDVEGSSSRNSSRLYPNVTATTVATETTATATATATATIITARNSSDTTIPAGYSRDDDTNNSVDVNDDSNNNNTNTAADIESHNNTNFQ